ncbi:MAG: DinB family protein [Planctomycetota bacterium]|jgi:uncharacterized damage-inducible protein DinB
MRETDRICQQMKQALEGGAWHGPAVLEILEGVDASAAAAKPIAGAHSIWELVLHLSGTQTILLRRLRGDATELTPEEDWPRVPVATEDAWRVAIDAFTRREAELRQAVAAFPAARLDQPLVAGGSSAYNNFHGHVQHMLYHAAQMGLLKKAGLPACDSAGSGRR